MTALTNQGHVEQHGSSSSRCEAENQLFRQERVVDRHSEPEWAVGGTPDGLEGKRLGPEWVVDGNSDDLENKRPGPEWAVDGNPADLERLTVPRFHFLPLALPVLSPPWQPGSSSSARDHRVPHGGTF